MPAWHPWEGWRWSLLVTRLHYFESSESPSSSPSSSPDSSAGIPDSLLWSILRDAERVGCVGTGASLCSARIPRTITINAGVRFIMVTPPIELLAGTYGQRCERSRHLLVGTHRMGDIGAMETVRLLRSSPWQRKRGQAALCGLSIAKSMVWAPKSILSPFPLGQRAPDLIFAHASANGSPIRIVVSVDGAAARALLGAGVTASGGGIVPGLPGVHAGGLLAAERRCGQCRRVEKRRLVEVRDSRRGRPRSRLGR